jgi:hypothetical protein
MSKSGTQGGGTARDVMGYKPPQGPTNIMDKAGPGLHGANLENCGTQGESSIDCDGNSGSPGLHGNNRGMGTNRG